MEHLTLRLPGRADSGLPYAPPAMNHAKVILGEAIFPLVKRLYPEPPSLANEVKLLGVEMTKDFEIEEKYSLDEERSHIYDTSRVVKSEGGKEQMKDQLNSYTKLQSKNVRRFMYTRKGRVKILICCI